MEVDPDLGHGLDDSRVDLVTWGRARRTHVGFAGGVVVEQGGGHLGSPGVVYADEQDFGYVFHEGSLGLGAGNEPAGGELLARVFFL